nr:MAG TPA: hypothetical protein [Caudoviricetes sp.]
MEQQMKETSSLFLRKIKKSEQEKLMYLLELSIMQYLLYLKNI